MAESFSVKATLSATDSGFSSTLKNASSAVDTLAGKVSSGIGFGILTGVGQAAFNTLTSGASSLISEIDSSNVAWKTFSGNMELLGKDTKYINQAKSELQSFAEQTVYSSSDMATTFSQLEAVGTKNTAKLVKGFGGLAAAAENPQQAMKTLSQQATQMAAKPKVAWEDFKLMLEQSPAGMAAVAKEMGYTTSELVTKIQDGKVSTDKFFAAIEKVGNSEGFMGLATEAKSVGQAMDGLQETLGNKLTPAFDVLSGVAIGAIGGIADKISGIDGEALADKVTAGLEKAQPYWEEFKGVLSTVGGWVKTATGFLLDHSDTISKALPYVIGLVAAYKAFKVVNSVAPGMMKFASSITSLASKGISGIAGKLFGIAGAQKATGSASAASATQVATAAKSFMMMAAAVLMISAGFGILAVSAIGLANAGPLAIGVMAGLLAAVVGLGFGMVALVKTLAPMAGQMMPIATAMLALGGAIALVAAGFALLTFAAISLANSGGLAIGVMVGMVAAIALLAVGAAALGPALAAGAVGFVAFGAAIALVGVGALLAAAALAVVSAVLPTISAYGLQGATAITALGASMMVFAVGAGIAGAACVVLGAGLTTVAVGLALVGAAVLLTAAGVLALSAGTLVLGAGLLICAAALTAISAVLMVAATGTLALTASFAALMAVSAGLGAILLVTSAGVLALGVSAAGATVGVLAFGVGMTTASIGVLAMSAALKGVKSQMKSISSSAKTAEKSLKSMKNSVKVVESGLDALGSKAKSAMNKLTSSFNDAASKSQSAGQKVGKGFAQGMQSGLVLAPVIAAQTVTATNARLSSGYSGAYSAGAYISQGFAQGMLSQLAVIKSAAAQMAAAADAAIRAKAKIHSPSKVADENGEYYGEGWVNGILSKVKDAWKAAEKLVTFPDLTTPDLAMAFGGELSSEYDYFRDSEYSFEIPVIVDGREVAKATATYTQDELDKLQMRDNRKHGRA